ncbi:InlB B-repeat-containing protein [Candidatus Saccharibacteria bacterium]|nr:InlB B-repeat-containing protein [Candidatus Saccharibacteria bacterium]
MSQIKAVQHKFSESASRRSSRSVGDSVQTTLMDHKTTTNKQATSTFTGLILTLVSALAVLALPVFLGASDTYAIPSTLSVGISGNPTINLPPTAGGKFADSGNVNITVTTTHAAGYALSARATGASNPTSLNTSGGTVGFQTLGTSNDCPSGINASDFDTADCNGYWGYKPSKHNSVDNTTDNYYFASPTANGDPMDTTSDNQGRTYTVSIGARADITTAMEAYSNTFVFEVVANATPYKLYYVDNSGEATGMPSDITDGTSATEGITLSSTEPSRDGYTFEGWCSVTTSSDACTGTTYAAGDTYNLNQTSSSNNISLYAIWKQAGPDVAACTTAIPNVGITYMQDITSSNKATVLSNMAQNIQYVLKDKRDEKPYCVAKLADGNIWMTQNLDLNIGGTGVAALTSENTDITTSGSGIYVTDYSTSNGVITWSPNPTNITPSGSATNNTLTGTPATITNFTSGSPSNSLSGWTNDNNKPYMAEGDDHYVYTSGSSDTSTLDTIYGSLSECTTTGGHTKEECAHYRVGNYYNWTAAIASSASSSIYSSTSDRYKTADNSICPKGWRLPKGRAATDTATTREFGELWRAAGITSSLTATSFATDGFLNIRQAPLFFARGGFVSGTTFSGGASGGSWWSSSVYSTTNAYYAYFTGSSIYSALNYNRSLGMSVRCIVR